MLILLLVLLLVYGLISVAPAPAAVWSASFTPKWQAGWRAAKVRIHGHRVHAHGSVPTPRHRNRH
jgi:hypothetical protein